MSDIIYDKRNYNNLEILDNAVTTISKVARPGDIINFIPRLDSWWNPLNIPYRIGFSSIISNQRRIYGKDHNVLDTHSTIFLSPCEVFSVEPPRAAIHHLRHFSLEPITIWRYTGRAITPDDIAIMRDPIVKLFGTPYDYGQLLDILVNTIMGYPHERKLSIFDFGRKTKVCSVGARVVYEHWLNFVHGTVDDPRNYLFVKHNPAHPFADPKYNENFKQVDVEMTCPADFSNSEFYDNEFELVGRFDNGLKID